ncbi:MAG: zinc metalloprotease HtpX [Candidatus Andersenbacteria bacterium RIFCSPHIGHO2_02_FULL_45_11]|nr:MAG: zinc metalloprotease HtpX [Candidatus Andersenbacteria bacterium RIFCSPHIGHO2_01_FULL_46_36]OGY32928.1 MAG: zinc metalloprotease HtpX [Candidatus Andersenbacteria bacterium RIFCSPHIGHO2_02_FULL_45_11]
MTIYSQISSNKRKSIFLVVIVLVFVIGVVALYSYSRYQDFSLAILAAILAIPSSLIGYYTGDKIALAANRAQAVTKEEAPELTRIIENLAITAGVPTPKIYIIQSPAMNAFATGRDPEHASIAVTTGLLHALEQSELEGVLAHELSHVKNYDIRFSTLVAIFVGFIVILSDLVGRSMFFGGGRRSRDNNQSNALIAIISIVLLLISPIIAQIIQLAISRQREYLADSSGALLTRYPEGLARALEKIAHSSPLETASNATAHLFIANPFGSPPARGGVRGGGSSFSGLLSTHPPLEERIKRLREI